MGLQTVLALGTCLTLGIMAISQAQPALALSSDASLDLLVISPGVLTPAFDSGTMAYTSVVPSTTATLSVTPTAAAGATVTVNGSTDVSGSPSPTIALTVGANSITTVVTAGNGVTQRTYKTDGGASFTTPVLPAPPAGAALSVTISAMQVRTWLCTWQAAA